MNSTGNNITAATIDAIIQEAYESYVFVIFISLVQMSELWAIRYVCNLAIIGSISG